MLRWILGGREAQGVVEKSSIQFSGEEQPQNCYTELQVLKGHFDIVRYLVQIDDVRFASAGDDGLVLVWNVESGERLHELRGHTQQITALVVYTITQKNLVHTFLISASSDRSVTLWDPDSGHRVQAVSDLQSSVKCILVLSLNSYWLSGGNDLCVWNRSFQLLGKVEQDSDTGVTAMVELLRNHVAVAVDRRIIIYELKFSSVDSSVSIIAVRNLANHQDTIRSLINVNDKQFASGCHAGELIIWDSADWTIYADEQIGLAPEPQYDGQIEVRLAQPKQNEMAIQHLASNGELVVATVGSGLYVYHVPRKYLVSHRKTAHDSDILHLELLNESELISCSEDGSVKIWELQDLPLPAEPTSAGFFGMWSFGRSSTKQGSPPKKATELLGLKSLELMGDLIGHSGAVQVFLNFSQSGLVTCSTDHLVIVWRDGDRQSHLRSIMLFEKLEENEGL
ncbi:WD repeat-containing protein 41 [Engraulis encrasicolus]|uniref:WD repeat-containing protein 41 n=1 Tax=Engraulis encrasicolus TaxID=184585 RepID=UPI002FCF92D4